MAMPERWYKLVVLGSGGVGKSALVVRFITGHYPDGYDPTVEDSYRRNGMVDEEPIVFDILDTAGQEEFASMQDQWMREGMGFVMVYSINSRKSLDDLEIIRSKLVRIKETEHIPIVIAGSKCDLDHDRQVPFEDGQKLAKEWGCSFYECSAKEEKNNEKIFYAAVQEIRKMQTNGGDGDGDGRTNNYRRDNNQKCKKLGEVVLRFCTGAIYICLLGCIFHGIYFIAKRMYQRGCCRCCKCIRLICRSCKCGRDPSMEDSMSTQERKQQLKLLFKKVEYIEEDKVREPVLALKNFRIVRRFFIGRFIKALLCGLFLPIVIIFQTLVFLTYSYGRDRFFYSYFYPKTYQYDNIHHSLLLDFLGLVVGRHPNQDPDAIKDRHWFLYQSQLQKLQRVGIMMLLCSTFVIVWYNIYEERDEKLRVSLMETVGPFTLFWIVWLLLSCWIAYGSELTPKMPNTYRLRSIKLYLGEEYTHMTDAHKFLRAYAWSRNKKLSLSRLRTATIIFLGLFYACIPGLTRLFIGDPSLGLDKKKFITKREWKVEAGALLVNFILVSSFIYAIEIQYAKHFDNYREWMFDLTMLLSKTSNDKEDNSNKEDEHYIPERGRNFSNDIFLSLTRKSNALGWLEIRSFLAAEGKLLFAEQELPTLWILLLTIALTAYLVARVFFIDGHPYESVLFNGASMLSIICLVSLIRIANTGYQFKDIQEKQEILLGEQRFFMRCRRDKTKKPSRPKLINNKSGTSFRPKRPEETIIVSLQEPSKYEGNMYTPDTEVVIQEDQPNTDLVQFISDELQTPGNLNEAKTESVMENIYQRVVGHHVLQPSMIKKLDEDEDDDELKKAEEKEDGMKNRLKKPLLDNKRSVEQKEDDNFLIIHMQKNIDRNVSKLDRNVSRVTEFVKADKFGFIENMLFIVHRKDIYPRLFNVKLNSILAQAIATILISGLAAAAKVLL